MDELVLWSRAQHAREALIRLDRVGHVLVSGVNGVGKSHLLGEIADLLERQGVGYRAVRCADLAAASRALDRAAPGSLVIVDDLELADLALLRAFSEHVARGGTSISALTSHNDHTPYATALGQAHEESAVAATVFAEAARLKVEPLSDTEMRRFLHTHASEPLDSLTVSRLCDLAWGRPGWALDLIVLAQAGQLTDDPRAAISPHRLREFNLAGMRSAAAAIGELSPSTAAAATVLSEIEPLDPTQAGDLTSDVAVRTLTSRGVLLGVGASSGFRTVPAFAAAALQHTVTTDALDAMRRKAASQLLMQETFGLQLGPTDSLFCARVAQPSESDPILGSSTANPALSAVLKRTADDLLSFGRDGSARALLMRGASIGVQLSGLFGARAMTTIGRPQQGLAKLASLPTSQDRSERIAAIFLRTLLAAESGANIEDPDSPFFSSPVPDDDLDAQRIFRLWNTVAPIHEQMSFIRHVMHESDSPDIRLTAGALCKFELLWHGYRPSPADHKRFLELLQHAGLTESVAYRDMIDTAILSYALTLLLSGDHVARAEELRRLVAHLPSALYHERWLTHLIETAFALTCGRADRALIEWKRFEQRIPRFVPLRLRARLSAFGEVIADAARHSPARGSATRTVRPAPSDGIRKTSSGWSPAHLVYYLTGQHHRIPSPTKPVDESTQLAVVALMHAHLSASRAQNPAELQGVASRLAALNLGASALVALTETREILVKRRSAGAVAKCDQQIAEIERAMLERVPWLRESDLPRATSIRLTPRELDVARLAARGLSNLEVSKRLHCSVRTVESHLSQARAKLGVSNRQELGSHPVLTG